MKKQFIQVAILLVLFALVLPMTSYATVEASYYLQYYDAYITKTGNNIRVYFEVQGTRIMDKVGATEIYLYEKDSGSTNWTLVQTFLSSDSTYSSSMIGTNTNYKYDYVSYSGTSSKQYMAYVTCYAEKDGGSDSRSISTNS